MEKERTEPWFTEMALAILDGALDLADHKPKVFEFGMGKSTIYFKNKCSEFTSVEHDEIWYKEISEKFNTKNKKHQLILLQRPYNKAIEEKPDNYYEIIIIDGRDRAKCIQSSIPKLKSGGWLILDNSERPYYQKGIDLMKDWNRIDCKQNRPDKYDFTYPDWTTSIFIKP